MDIRKIRKELKLNQKEFGDKVGVSRQTIINWEKGEKIPESKMSFIRQLLKKDYPDLSDLKAAAVSEPGAEYSSKKDAYIESLERIIESKDEMIATLKDMIEIMRKNAAENFKPKE